MFLGRDSKTLQDGCPPFLDSMIVPLINMSSFPCVFSFLSLFLDYPPSFPYSFGYVSFLSLFLDCSLSSFPFLISFPSSPYSLIVLLPFLISSHSFPYSLIVLYSLLYSTTGRLCQQTISPETAVPTHLGHPSILTFNLRPIRPPTPPNLPPTHPPLLTSVSSSTCPIRPPAHPPTYLPTQPS